MIRSLNELQGLVLKAARGAGVPLGHAEDLAFATPHLAEAQALACLPAALKGPHLPPQGQVSAGILTLSDARAVMAGPVALDALQAGVEAVEMTNTDAPEIISALAAASGDIHVLTPAPGTLRLTRGAVQAHPPHGPVEVPDALWSHLSDLAQNTYVPATEASRLKGAGAGLTDND